jgi:hypothetical protein
MADLRLNNRNILIATGVAGAEKAFAVASALNGQGANIEAKIGRTHIHGTLNLIGPGIEPENVLCSDLETLNLTHASMMLTRWAGFKMLQTGGGGLMTIPFVEGDPLNLSCPDYEIHAAAIDKHSELMREEFRGNLLAVHALKLGYVETAKFWATDAGKDHLTAIMAAKPMLRSVVLGELVEILVTIFVERQPRMAGQIWQLGTRI